VWGKIIKVYLAIILSFGVSSQAFPQEKEEEKLGYIIKNGKMVLPEVLTYKGTFTGEVIRIDSQRQATGVRFLENEQGQCPTSAVCPSDFSEITCWIHAQSCGCECFLPKEETSLEEGTPGEAPLPMEPFKEMTEPEDSSEKETQTDAPI